MELFARTYPWLFALCVLLFLSSGLATAMLAGYRTARRLNHPADSGLGVIESSVFAVFGLLVAFMFTGAADRFTARRGLILEEAKATQTSWDQLGLLPEPTRSTLRARLRSYMEAKLKAYGSIGSYEELERDLLAAAEMARSLVADAVEACRQESGQPYVELVIPPLSQLREVSLARRTAIWHHPPTIVYGFLICLGIVCAYYSGFSLPPAIGERRLQVGGFSLALGSALYLTLDLEFPRMGILRVDGADAILRGVLELMR